MDLPPKISTQHESGSCSKTVLAHYLALKVNHLKIYAVELKMQQLLANNQLTNKENYFYTTTSKTVTPQ